ncbi:MAG: GIY-YIG nuclease family protein [Pseudomonadota bacterium]
MDVVCILTNEAMPGLVKVGKTKGDLLGRIKGLDSTGVQLPFECFFAAEVANCDLAEKLLHDAFDDHRVRKNREFFEIAPERISSALKLAAIREVTPTGPVVDEPEDVAAIKKAKDRRSRFNFRIAQIPVGAVLLHDKDEAETCTVIDNRNVLYDGAEMSLSQSALKVFYKLGYSWSAVSGPGAWIYEGETLDERRRRIEEED